MRFFGILPPSSPYPSPAPGTDKGTAVVPAVGPGRHDPARPHARIPYAPYRMPSVCLRKGRCLAAAALTQGTPGGGDPYEVPLDAGTQEQGEPTPSPGLATFSWAGV